MRIIRLVAGLLLLPLCYAAARTLFATMMSLHAAGNAALTPEEWALLVGFGLWLFLYFTMPRPVRSYILAHELTHALWAWMSGATVHGIKVAEDRGSVELSRSTFLITLAPYFFPLYTVIVIIVYIALSVFFNVADYNVFWMGLIGLTWGFHFTFTISTLLQHQTDIKDCGYIFSYALIFLLNVLGIIAWIVIVSEATLEGMVSTLCQEIRNVAGFCTLGYQRLREVIGQ